MSDKKAKEELVFDYKNPQLLKNYITDRGKIRPRRTTHFNAKEQRHLSQ